MCVHIGLTMNAVYINISTDNQINISTHKTKSNRVQKEGVAVGDVIYIEANSGAVKRVGRSDAFATEFDLEVSAFVICG